MKKIFLMLFVAASLFTSCNISVNDQAEMVIEDYINDHITAPLKYEPIETKVDSAYAPLDSPEMYKLFDKYVKATNNLMVHHKMITEMQTKMGKFTDMYSDSLIASLNPIIKSLEDYVSLLENMDRMMDMPEEFVGYKAVHRFKIIVNDNILEHKDMIMFNKDLSSVEYRMKYSSYEFASAEIAKLRTNIKSTIETYRTTIDIAKKLTE